MFQSAGCTVAGTVVKWSYLVPDVEANLRGDQHMHHSAVTAATRQHQRRPAVLQLQTTRDKTVTRTV
jgi:hypothetical protein